MFHQLIHINYATLLIVVFMITFLLSNTIFNKRITRLFFVSILCVLFLVIADSIETWTEAPSKTDHAQNRGIGYWLYTSSSWYFIYSFDYNP